MIKRILSILISALLLFSATAITSAANSESVTFTLIEGTSSPYGCPPENMLDGDIATKWCLNDCPCYITFSSSAPIAVAAYELSTADDNKTNPGRNPENWTLYGSNDGSSWEVIHTVAGDNTMQDVNYTPYMFEVNSKKAYTYFKYEVTLIENESCLQLSGIRLLDAETYEAEKNAPDPLIYTFISGTQSPYGCPPEQLIDGLTASKWCHSENPSYVTFSVNKPISISGYILTTANDNDINPGRNPADWNLYGSNDGENWALIDSVKNDSTMDDVNFEPYTFELDDATPEYSYFKFEVTKIWNEACLQLSELTLIEAESDEPVTEAPATDAPATEPDAPSTDAPSTDAPSTDAPGSEPGDPVSPSTYDIVFSAAAVVLCASAGAVLIIKKRSKK